MRNWKMIAVGALRLRLGGVFGVVYVCLLSLLATPSGSIGQLGARDESILSERPSATASGPGRNADINTQLVAAAIISTDTELVSEGDTYKFSVSTGQAGGVGRLTGSNYSLDSGFWPTTVVCEGDPDCDGDGINDQCAEQRPASRWDPMTACADGNGMTVPDYFCWNTDENWCPTGVPNNQNGVQFDVILAHTRPATLDTDATLRTLELLQDTTLEVNQHSGIIAPVLTVNGTTEIESGVKAIVIGANAVLQVVDNQELLVTADEIDQTDGGKIEASGGSVLNINRAKIKGGTAETDDSGARIQLLGGAQLDGVNVKGVVVPDGQIGRFAGVIINRGILGVAPLGLGETLFTASEVDTKLESGIGAEACVRLGGQSSARIGGFKVGFTNAHNHQIEGAGVVFGELVNDGVIEANCDVLEGRADACASAREALILKAPGPKVNNGILRVRGSGTLRIEDDVTGMGGFQVGGGPVPEGINAPPSACSAVAMVTERATVSAGRCVEVPPPGTPCEALLHIDSGSAFVAQGLGPESEMAIGMGGTVLVDDATVILEGALRVCPLVVGDVDFAIENPRGRRCGILPAGYTGTTKALLCVDGSTSSIRASDLDICAEGVIAIQGTIAVADSYTFTNQMVSDLNWLESSVLRVESGCGGAGYTTLEVGGRDLGTDPDKHLGAPEGFSDNFDLATLVIGSGADVLLVDAVDNGHRGGPGGSSEALYVDTLVFEDDTSQLNLNGIHLYVRNSFQALPGQVANFLPLRDYAYLLDCIDPDAEAKGSCADFYDVDGNGSVTVTDARVILADELSTQGCSMAEARAASAHARK